MKSEKNKSVNIEIAAEAAVWVSRLHGPSRSPQMDAEFQTWQVQSVQHRLAFERCTDVWEDVRGISLATAYASAGAEASGHGGRHAGVSNTTTSGDQTTATKPNSNKRKSFFWVSVAGVAASVLLGFAGLLALPSRYSTAIGEQRTVVLEDGSRVFLNTNSQLAVRYGKAERLLHLEKGEAIFEVAKNKARPFKVQAANMSVEALGTVFSVRALPEEVSVTLLEGSVSVNQRGDTSKNFKNTRVEAILPTPGERIKINVDAVAAKDKPRIDQLLSWKRGEVDFDASSLSQAAAEMNRYSRTPIIISQSKKADRRVSGVFKLGDSLSFAQAAAELHQLRVVEYQDRIELVDVIK